MYFIEFDGCRIFMPLDSFEDAKEMIETSERLTIGKVVDINGNVLFKVDRTEARKNEEIISAKYCE